MPHTVAPAAAADSRVMQDGEGALPASSTGGSGSSAPNDTSSSDSRCRKARTCSALQLDDGAPAPRDGSANGGAEGGAPATVGPAAVENARIISVATACNRSRYARSASCCRAAARRSCSTLRRSSVISASFRATSSLAVVKSAEMLRSRMDTVSSAASLCGRAGGRARVGRGDAPHARDPWLGATRTTRGVHPPARWLLSPRCAAVRSPPSALRPERRAAGSGGGRGAGRQHQRDTVRRDLPRVLPLRSHAFLPVSGHLGNDDILVQVHGGAQSARAKVSIGFVQRAPPPSMTRVTAPRSARTRIGCAYSCEGGGGRTRHAGLSP